MQMVRLMFHPLKEDGWIVHTKQIHVQEWKVAHDHNYAMDVPSNVFFPTYDHGIFNIPIPPQHDLNVVSSEDTANAFVNGNESDADDDEDLDPNWQLPDDDRILSDGDIVPSEDEFQESSPEREKNFLFLGHA